MMTPNPFEKDLIALMQDYAAPVDDDGFSARIVKQTQRQSVWRRAALCAASLVSGIIVATQFSNLRALAGRLPAPDLPKADVTAPLEFTVGLSRQLNAATSFDMAGLMIPAFGLTLMLLWFAKDWLDGQV